MHKILSFLALFTVLASSGLPAAAQIKEGHSSHITVNGVQRYFMVGKSPVQNIEVTNRSQRVFELNTVVEERLNPGGGKLGEEVQYKDMEDSFLFAPKRFRLKPGETRRVRMVRSAPHDDAEHAYRVAFMPTKEGLDAESKNAQKEGIEMGVQMVLSTGMLVLVSPRNVKEKLTYVRDAEAVTFTNEGTVAIDMRKRLSYCYNAVDGENQCIGLPPKRIYPGKSWRFEIDGDIPLEYYYSVYEKPGKNSPVNIKPAF